MLGAEDARRYAAIFSLQESGQWQAADAEIAPLQDKLLLGSVLAQRYLSPHYRMTVAEAKSWLSSYADQPEARAIWALARHRGRGKAMPHPQARLDAQTTEAALDAAAQAMTHDPAVNNVSAQAAPAGTPAAEDAAGLAQPQAIGSQTPARFLAGIAAWKSHRFDQAATDFESVAHNDEVSSWYVAAGAFWAARARMVQRQPEAVNDLLELAASQPRTFYGMLARRLLGMSDKVQFGPRPPSPAETALLKALPPGRRAIALIQVGETDRAEAELRALSSRRTMPGLPDAIVALADVSNMPALCLAMSWGRQTADARMDDAAYPVPGWKPRNGFSVDRALLFALMMQESRFDRSAQSYAGAAGLMQLMPRTARAVARKAGIPFNSVNDLVDPVLNLSIGQEYVKELLDYDEINGNLILVLAAYNSGPASLARMEADPVYHGDPLLFIESLPSNDRRLYVERVLTNMWIYRARLGQATPDLDALAANQWPSYVSVDAQQQEMKDASAR